MCAVLEDIDPEAIDFCDETTESNNDISPSTINTSTTTNNFDESNTTHTSSTSNKLTASDESTISNTSSIPTTNNISSTSSSFTASNIPRSRSLPLDFHGLSPDHKKTKVAALSPLKEITKMKEPRESPEQNDKQNIMDISTPSPSKADTDNDIALKSTSKSKHSINNDDDYINIASPESTPPNQSNKPNPPKKKDPPHQQNQPNKPDPPKKAKKFLKKKKTKYGTMDHFNHDIPNIDIETLQKLRAVMGQNSYSDFLTVVDNVLFNRNLTEFDKRQIIKGAQLYMQRTAFGGPQWGYRAGYAPFQGIDQDIRSARCGNNDDDDDIHEFKKH